MYGGTGKVMNYDLIPKEGIRKPFFIAGGLHSKNIKEITKKYHALDEHGKKAVESILDIEYKRCTETNRNKSKTITFKRFNVNKASAGCGYDLSNSDVWREIEVIDTPEAHEADFAVEVDGHSMEPTISDGSIVYLSLIHI